MSEEVHVHDGTSWKQAKEIHVNAGASIWRTVLEKYVHDGTAWKLVFKNYEASTSFVNFVKFIQQYGEYAYFEVTDTVPPFRLILRLDLTDLTTTLYPYNPSSNVELYSSTKRYIRCGTHVFDMSTNSAYASDGTNSGLNTIYHSVFHANGVAINASTGSSFKANGVIINRPTTPLFTGTYPYGVQGGTIGYYDGSVYALTSLGILKYSSPTVFSIVNATTFSDFVSSFACTPDGNMYFNIWLDTNLYCLTPAGTLTTIATDVYDLGTGIRIVNYGDYSILAYPNTGSVTLLYKLSGTTVTSLGVHANYPPVADSATGEVYVINASTVVRVSDGVTRTLPGGTSPSSACMHNGILTCLVLSKITVFDFSANTYFYKCSGTLAWQTTYLGKVVCVKNTGSNNYKAYIIP